MIQRLALRLSLMVCTREFRQQFADQLIADGETANTLASAWDIATTGVLMRLESLGHDLRSGWRSLTRAPLVTAIAVAAMALAIAANFIVASLVQGFFLRPLPFEAPRQLLFVQETDLGRALSYPDAQLFAAQLGSYGDLALAMQQRVVLSGGPRPALVSGAAVSANYFTLLGLHPALGHFFSNDADTASVVISYELWQEHFAGSAQALGQVLNLGRHSYQVIGVAPQAFHDPTPYGFVNRQYWVAIDPHDPRTVTSINYNGIVRVHAGLDARTVARDLRDRLGAIVKARASVDGSMCCVAVAPIADKLSGPMEPLLVLLYAFVSVVVIIAFVNVANLNIARNTARAGDLSVRVALGASPGRIATQLTIEAFIQALLGTLIGLALAYAALHQLSVVASPYLPQMSALGLSWGLVVYAFAIVAVATFVTGVLPGLGRSGSKIAATLKSVGRSEDGRDTKRTLSRLVVVEVALATALVVAAGLILHSVIATTRISLGFDPDNLYLATVTLPDDGSISSDQQSRYVARTLDALASTLGASNVAASLEVPLNCCSTTTMTVTRGSDAVSVLYNAVSPHYFDTLQIPLLAGRVFTDGDTERAPCVAVVDETLARNYYGSPDVIGRTLAPDVFSTPQQCSIVGVVRSVPQAYGQPQAPMLYLSLAQVPHFAQFIVRMPAQATDASAQILRATDAADPHLPPPAIMAYGTLMQQQLAVPWISALVFGTLSLIALMLALTGIYALMAYAVARQTREFGIRTAIGATPGDILRQVFRAAAKHGGIGIAIGVVLAALLSVPLKSLLYGTSQGEPIVYGGVIVLVLGFTLGAALVPAIRAARVAPATALRHE
jgi:predicted permease